MIRVAIADLQTIWQPKRGQLHQLVRTVLRREGIRKAEISLVLVNDRKMAELHWRFLARRGPTDVLTFPLEEPELGSVSGEIVVSTETGRATARRLKHAISSEIALYVIHGLLHLCGYDDHSAPQRRKMREKEAEYLRHFGIPLTIENQKSTIENNENSLRRLRSRPFRQDRGPGRCPRSSSSSRRTPRS